MPRLFPLVAALTFVVACDPAAPSSLPASGPVTASAVGSGSAASASVAPSTPPHLPREAMSPKAGAPLDELCGGAKTEPCPTLTAHLAALRGKECSAQSTPPKQRACGRFTQVDVNYGIVGYTRFFDPAGVLVGAIAHLYEYGGARQYGNIPADCSGAPATSICGETKPSGR